MHSFQRGKSHTILIQSFPTMTPPVDDDSLAAAATTLTKMKAEGDEQKQEAREQEQETRKRKEAKKRKKRKVDALCATLRAKKERRSTSLYLDPKEKIKAEAASTLSVPCMAAINRCIKEGVLIPDSLKQNPAVAMPDPRLNPRPKIAPVEDDSLLMEWPEEGAPDPEKRIDKKLQKCKCFDKVVEVDPKPGERATLGWYCVPQSSIRKKPKDKKKRKEEGEIVMTGTINIKKNYD